MWKAFRFSGSDAKRLIFLGLVARLVLVLFAFFQDAYFKVKYTDIDYEVYTDAALHVLRGRSPFDRETYRYTPLIAHLLVPNHVLFKAFGKVLFSNADVMIAIVHLKLLRGEAQSSRSPGREGRSVVEGGAGNPSQNSVVLWALGLWLFNPYTATISSRGSSDSISSLCIVFMLLLLERRKHAAAGFWYGLAVHIRIFPIIYVLPLLVHLGRPSRSIFTVQNGFRDLVSLNESKAAFALSSAFTFAALCLAFYLAEGQRYLDEAILYHFGRYDLAHNFSPWFFIFRVVTNDGARKVLGLAAFLPQVLCLAYYGLIKASSLPYSLFMVTLSFVALNKVVTAQYFAWYLVLLPLVFPSILSPKSAVAVRKALKLAVFLWVLSQLNWLFWAYLYEFEKMESALFPLFLSSVVFVASNVKLMLELDKSYESKTHTHPSLKTRAGGPKGPELVN
ncbi:mannosyltransferase [Chloropicon primus]|uniref:GPI mannosyltransferase 1 n=1 Tax=Chloropicon primus TaxID=1764295 RepID=A0A5B8MK09_9CHLO|nr:mannosyltransferase [Chloropicon primus]UPQ98904.1 mannosyltransferase [Chloropicon primus]|eukprot:QDZ19692.1 mannosyltransferase [Chloropicon primus]